jgi:hypothetical protein
MTVPIDIVTDAGNQRMDIDKKGIIVTSKTNIQIDPTVFYLKKVIYE